jgi:excisionase family DNA binding protein
MKEPMNYRETLASLKERFSGRDSINQKQLASYLGLSPSVVSTAIRNGEVPGQKVGNTYVITLNQLAHWETKNG